MGSIILSAKNISKTFSNSKNEKLEVLKNISLEIEKQKISMIVGASGAGKSTLLHILSGLDTADSGTVEISSTNIFSLNDDKLSRFRNKYIGFVFQFNHLLPEFDAQENVAIPMMINGDSLTKSKKRAAELLDLVGLNQRLNHRPSELSGGEAQRVAVARALANSPEIIFADEPTGNLDSANSEMLHKLIFDLRDKLSATFLIVTHNPELIKLGDVVFEMKDGKIFKRNGDNNE